MREFPYAVVAILRGNNVFDDLARLTYANITICSVSTFCLWPAIASNHTAIFPKTRLIAKEDTSFDYGTSFHWINDSPILGVKALHMTNQDLVRQLVK